MLKLSPIEISPGIFEAIFTPPLESEPGSYYVLAQLIVRDKATRRIVVVSGEPKILRLDEPDLIGILKLQVDEAPLLPRKPVRLNVTYFILNLPVISHPKLDVTVNGTKIYSSPLAEPFGSVLISLVTPAGASSLQIT
ncbi:MAG: hypothetical protein DRO01_05425, partial [Thermoproteota archaeon]